MDAASETKKLKIVTFKHGQPEDLLQLMKNFKRAFDGTDTKTAAGKINYLCTLLRGEALQEFDKLSSKNAGTKRTHLKFIQEGLLSYFFPINALSKHKCAMRRAMRKPRDIPFKRFTVCLTELNNYLPFFLGYSAAKNMPPEYLNEILLHAVPNSRAKQAYIQGWEFDMKRYKATCKLFEIMEVTDKIYKGGNTSKTLPRADNNCAIQGRKQKRGEATPPTNPETGRAGKSNTRNAGHPGDCTTGGKKCFLNSPGHSTEECKVLKDYSTKYATERPHKEEAYSSGNKNVVRTSSLTAKQKRCASRMLMMHIPQKRKREKVRQISLRVTRILQFPKRRKHTYGIVSINLGEPTSK